MLKPFTDLRLETQSCVCDVDANAALASDAMTVYAGPGPKTFCDSCVAIWIVVDLGQVNPIYRAAVIDFGQSVPIGWSIQSERVLENLPKNDFCVTRLVLLGTITHNVRTGSPLRGRT